MAVVSYHVFFSPKAGIADESVIAWVHDFLSEMEGQQQIEGYRLMRVTDPASFAGLPRFQAIIDFLSEKQRTAAFQFMRVPGRMTRGAHGQIMHSVTDFKVSFSVDV